MHKIAFQLGDWTIYWYGILAACGFLAAFWTASRRAPGAGIQREAILDLGPWLILGAILGARAYYVIGYWRESFAGKPWTEIFMLRHGGLVWYGGFVGAVIATALYCRRKKLELWKAADVMAPSIPLGHAFGRVGCFMNGCCYGRPTNLPWAAHFPYGHETYPLGVHPTEIYEALLNLGLFLGLAWWFRRRKFDGQIFAAYLIGYALVRGFVEIFRGDYTLQDRYFGGWIAPGQFFSFWLLLAGIVLWAWLKSKASSASGAATAHHGRTEGKAVNP